jgi:uncharacterized protein
MKRRSFLQSLGTAGCAAGVSPAWGTSYLADWQGVEAGTSDTGQAAGQASPEKILLQNYRPKSIHKVPVTEVSKAKFPIIDMHSHAYPKTREEISEWVRSMDEVGIEKTILLTETWGQDFEDVQRQFAPYPGRFEIWCGFDYTGYDQPGFGSQAIRALEKCHTTGAGGVGELHDKGKGLVNEKVKAYGMHPDDGRMDSLFERCGQLGMPVNLHVADPIWMYQPMDKHNDDLMNAYHWRLDNQPGIVGLCGMIDILERTVKKHSNTTFIACHFANLDYDLAHLGQVLDKFSNLYSDISASLCGNRSHPALCGKVLRQLCRSPGLWHRHGIRQGDVSRHVPDSRNLR